MRRRVCCITQVGGDDIGAGLQARGVNLRGGITTGNFHVGGIPGVCDGALGIEIGATGSGGYSLAGEDFRRLRGTRSGRRKWRLSATEVKNQPSLQAYTTEVGTRNRGGTKAIIRHCKISPEQPESNVSGYVHIETATDHEPELVDIV